MDFCGRELKIEGRLCRVAHLDADDYKFLDDPETVIGALRQSKMRIDFVHVHAQIARDNPKILQSDGVGQYGCPIHHDL